MVQQLLGGLALILVLGIGAQFLAWRLRLPAILLLLVVGFAAGPVLGLVDPDAILGELLFPFVSLAVAVILFEGGLSLDIGELREIGRVVRNLVTMQVVVTWVLGTALAYLLLGLPLTLATLFAAILTVTGPTVIVPLLRHMRPQGRVGSTVRWEGIVNDPIGAMLAVLVFEAIVSGGFQRGVSLAVTGVLKTLLFGGVLGIAAAAMVVLVLRRHWVPDFLQNPMVLTLVISVFTLSNMFQPESGLLAVTMMGIALASQKLVAVRHVVEFKEVLRVLLLSILFVTLAARLPLTDADYSSPGSWLFLGTMIFLIRPVAVGLATMRSDFSWRERLFLAVMAPRGIVAAAVASLFALELSETQPEAARLVPLTFLMIAGTVTVYGLSTPRVARLLRLATPNPQGMLLIGAAPWARETAKVLEEEGIQVVLADSNWANVAAARREGLQAHYLDALTERAVDELELGGLGRVLALTPNDEVNALVALHFGEVFGRSNVYQLPTGDEYKDVRRQTIPTHLRGRLLFADDATFEHLNAQYQNGWTIKKTSLTDEFDFTAFREHYDEKAIPLFLIGDPNDISIFTVTDPPTPRPGYGLISLVEPKI